jgi:hypothetical protein
MTDFRNRAFQFFSQQGWSPVAAAALAGQGNWESRGNPSQVHDGGIGLGLFGWNGDRRKALYDFASQYQMDPTAEDTQLRFAQHELTSGNERKWGDALRNASDLTGATNAVMGYLRPSGWTESNPAAGHGYAQRYNEAAPLLNASQMAQAAPATDDRDMVGFGGSPPPAPRVWDEGKQPFMASKNPYGDVTKVGLGLLAAGAPQQSFQPTMMQPGAAYRGNAQALSLLDTLTKRGLLG